MRTSSCSLSPSPGGDFRGPPPTRLRAACRAGPAGAPGTTEVEEFLRRLAQRHGPVMRPKGLALDDHAVVEQDMQDIEQRQFRTAPRPSPGSEGATDFTFERPRVAFDGDLVEEPFHFPLH